MMFWNRNKKEKAAAGSEKNRFDHLLSVAEKLPVKALPDLIRAIVRPVQGSVWKTESMVTPVFATPILTTSWLA
ncbi:hypothetical protein VBJ67_23520 [Enterobacter hormaechei]|nr:hypothetical protein [Enterobacter hormaechei]